MSLFEPLSEDVNLRSSFKRLKAIWATKTPKQKWQMIYDFGSFGSEIIQINLYSTLKFGWLGYLIGIMCTLYYCMMLYTIYYYIDKGHPQGCVKSFCIFGVISAVSS